MPNKNYLSGRRKEYKVKKKFERQGYIVLRTAGSHGFADLVAIDIREKKIIFIQCKPNDFSKKKETELNVENEFINKNYECKFEVI